MKKRQIIIIVVPILIIIGSVFTSQFLAEQKTPPEKVKPKEAKKYVKTEKVAYAEIPTSVIAYGRVKSGVSLDIIPEVSGRMVQGNIRLKEGQSFKKGDLLIKIDDAEARLRLQSQASNFLKDLAAIAPDLKVDFPEKYQKWYDYFQSIDIEKPLPALPEFSSQKEKNFMATKGILSSYYTIKAEEEKLSKYRYYAPFNGSIISVELQSGSFVNPGSRIASVIRTDEMELTVSVPLDEIDWVKRGKKASVFSETGKHEWVGFVNRISDQVNPNTQAIDVHLSLVPSFEPIYDGQYLKAVIPGRVIEKGMEIPRRIIVNANKVYTVENDSTLKIQEVEILKVNPETVVFAGLSEGTDIVSEQLINASNNMKVFKLSDMKEEKEIDTETPAIASTSN